MTMISELPQKIIFLSDPEHTNVRVWTSKKTKEEKKKNNKGRSRKKGWSRARRRET
jgi:hypothetical protein